MRSLTATGFAGVVFLFIVSTAIADPPRLQPNSFLEVFTCPDDPDSGRDPSEDQLNLAYTIVSEDRVVGGMTIGTTNDDGNREGIWIDLDFPVQVGDADSGVTILHGSALALRYRNGRPVLLEDSDVLVIIEPSLESDAKISVLGAGAAGESSYECRQVR